MWKTVQYSKNQVDKAAHTILQEDISKEEREQALTIIDNWRAAHAFPMNTFAVNLKEKASYKMGILVAQRLKRLDTIIGKLSRYPDMKLSRMQDLGGCRVIVPKLEDVYIMRDKIMKSRIRHKLHNEKDYIKDPNPNTGYRGVHLVYKYKSDRNDSYNGLLIEIQIRTKLQHLWATTVETVGTFTNNGLKFNQGEEDWLRFFQLTSALFAWEEGTAISENVPQDKSVLLNELFELISKLYVFEKLRTIAMISKQLKRIEKKMAGFDRAGYYLMVLNLKEYKLHISYYTPTEKAINEAIAKYMKIEEEKDESTDAVLVSAQSITALKRAYPNYFANIADFSQTLVRLAKKHAGLSKTTEN